MSQRRWRIVGVQAAAVAVLVLLVYVTLLRPEDQGPLRGIEAPGGGPQASVPAGPTGRTAPTGDRRGDGAGRRAAAPPEARAARLEAGPWGWCSARPPRVSAALRRRHVVGPGPNTPSDDQYKDSAKALLDKVATGGLISE